MLHSANGHSTSDKLFGKRQPADADNGGAAQPKPKLSERLKEFQESVKAGTANGEHLQTLLAAVFDEASKPLRPNREGSELTPERSELVDNIAADIQHAIAARMVDHGPDNERATELVLATALNILIANINRDLHPGFSDRFIKSLLLASLLRN